MISSKIDAALNRQIDLEGFSSMYYLAMGSWAEVKGYTGVAQFLYHHSDEERLHMLKLFHYINDRGGHAIVPPFAAPQKDFKNIQEIFEIVHSHEVKVSNEINALVELCIQEKDYTTHNFLQWYVTEQIEEESLARQILDKLKLIGEDKGGMYLFDRDLGTLNPHGGAGGGKGKGGHGH
ncbi:ferritin [Pseudoflavitalea sp. X16]|uniref:ferritin n=1 Tax=Paraflavitalea devenefica TaxID=2716334 RepID=UPI00141E998F|nr:ferritin [Paraflavitalea devenefica]NII25744.1 ferritin [Paraflavitalea devenefica]